jgi:hypothetical protein
MAVKLVQWNNLEFSRNFYSSGNIFRACRLKFTYKEKETGFIAPCVSLLNELEEVVGNNTNEIQIY